jgi:hypothetical protein
MKDFRIVHAKSILKVHSVAPIRGFLPPSVVVVGERLDRTREVLYNGLQANEFIVSSASRLIVRIPESQVGKELSDLQVLSSVSLTRLDTLISLELSKPPKQVEGIDRLIQAWLMIFYTTPGSDIFNPSSGGGVQTLIGRSTDRTGKNVAADLVEAIDRTRQELLRIQTGNARIPPSERLLSAELQGIQFDPNSTLLSARVSIRNVLSESAEISIR